MNTEDKQNRKKVGAWWEPAVTIFSEVSTWIAGPIIIALIAGKALDTHYGTKPTITLISVGVAFLITCYGMVRTVKNYIRKLKEQAAAEKQNSQEEK